MTMIVLRLLSLLGLKSRLRPPNKPFFGGGGRGVAGFVDSGPKTLVPSASNRSTPEWTLVDSCGLPPRRFDRERLRARGGLLRARGGLPGLWTQRPPMPMPSAFTPSNTFGRFWTGGPAKPPGLHGASTCVRRPSRAPSVSMRVSIAGCPPRRRFCPVLTQNPAYIGAMRTPSPRLAVLVAVTLAALAGVAVAQTPVA